ncbi:DUF2642 domain-containing protein [Shouchella shacheensis]|uniref:DUF2642 domain-containing protein n=1 Tax=Shouchella shacheensis TaxID=1649580 RepID=UPI0007403064|nr:DUF2642 domain-containing protein [Shouchella shacheensis]
MAQRKTAVKRLLRQFLSTNLNQMQSSLPEEATSSLVDLEGSLGLGDLLNLEGSLNLSNPLEALQDILQAILDAIEGIEDDGGSGTSALRDLLETLVAQQIEVTTPFGVVSGTLVLVQNDFIVMVDDTGTQVLVRLAKIESVNEL